MPTQKTEPHSTVCGIYKITNTLSGKCYIGQSVDIYNRWRQHLRLDGIPHNSAIDLAIQKYGANHFTLEILQECVREELNQLEIQYVELYDSYAPKGYNIALAGSRRTTINQCKVVSSYTLTGELVFTYSSINEAARAINVTSASIHAVLTHTNGAQTAGNLQWRLGNAPTIEALPQLRAGKFGGKKVFCYDRQTRQLIATYSSTFEAEHATKVDRNNVAAACNGRLLCPGGYYWSYIKYDILPKNHVVINLEQITTPDATSYLLVNIRTLEVMRLSGILTVIKFLDSPGNSVYDAIKNCRSLKHWVIAEDTSVETEGMLKKLICSGKYDNRKVVHAYILNVISHEIIELKSVAQRIQLNISTNQIHNSIRRGDLVKATYRVFRTHEEALYYKESLNEK